MIRLVALMHVRLPLSLWIVEDLLFERGIAICHETVRPAVRRRAMLRFRQMKGLQTFASVHASLERHLVDRKTYQEQRSAALAEWQGLAS